MQNIKVKYHCEEAKPIGQAHEGEWCDVRTAEDALLFTGEYKPISLGISVELPKGVEAILSPRSSTFRNFGIILTNSIGVFDEKYCGENDIWYFPAYATRDCFIKAGTRIAQFKLQKTQETLNIIEVDKMDNINRGGLGSTGTK